MPDRVGQQIGNYRLVKLLGKGGFAEVYLGQHVHLASKQAAIKILYLIDIDARKFQEEAETTEKLVHPHIVRLLDFAIEQGVPFLVLDFAPGGSLRTCHPKGSIVPPSTVGAYLKELAPALQYAHDRSILHRDIKPDNMLIGRGGELLLSDFGIAVLAQTGRTSALFAYSIGGTPYYMAPEAYQGKPEKASDQYALAVVVYEWLCGSVPFSEGNFIQLGYQHAYEPIPPLREKNPAIPPEVEAVIMKALSKDSKQRFASVQEFASMIEQVSLFRQPTTVTFSSRQMSTDLLPTLKVSPPLGTSLYVYRGHSDSEGVLYESEKVNAVAWSPDGKRIASGGNDRTVQAWNATNGENVFIYRGHSSSVTCLAWSPDGKYIASGGNIVQGSEGSDRSAQIWNAINDRKVLRYEGHTRGGVTCLTWSPDGRYIVSGGGDMTAQVWNTSLARNFYTYRRHSRELTCVAWSPDGKQIASGSYDNTVQVWDAANGRNVLRYQGHSSGIFSDAVTCLAWSPDGKQIASGGFDRTVQVWDVLTGQMVYTYRGHAGSVSCVAWSPDGKRIASGGDDKTVQIWDVLTGQMVHAYRGHANLINALAWSPDGNRIASGAFDVQVWQAV